MDVITHDAQGIDLKVVFFLALLQGIEQHFPTVKTSKLKLPVVAPYGNVIAVAWLYISGLTCHLGSAFSVFEIHNPTSPERSLEATLWSRFISKLKNGPFASFIDVLL